MSYDDDDGQVQIMTPSAAGIMARAEIDVQIATAQQYPRRISLVAKSITDLVTFSEAAAAECQYSLPRGGKPITGPTIRFAEAVGTQWGNCRMGSRVIEVNRKEKYVEAEGVFHDLQTNAATVKRVRSRITDKHGKLLNDDMITVTGNATASKAMRNAILAGVPRTVWMVAYDAAMRTAQGDEKTLTERRRAALKMLSDMGLKPKQVFELLDVSGEEDIGLGKLGDMRGMVSAIRTGETTVEDMLAELEAARAPANPGAITNQRQANPAADEAMQKEAEAAAQRRQAEEQAAAKEAEELEQAYEEYRQILEEEPDKRMRKPDTVRAKIREELDKRARAAEAEAANQAGPEEEGEGLDQTFDPGSEEQEESSAPNEAKNEPAPRETAPQEEATDPLSPAQRERYRGWRSKVDEITGDLAYGGDPADLFDAYRSDIGRLKDSVPSLHTELMAAFRRAGYDGD